MMKRSPNLLIMFFIFLLLIFSNVACNSPATTSGNGSGNEPTPTAVVIATPSATPTSTVALTSTPTITPTPTSTITPTSTPTITPTPTSTVTPTPTITPTNTPTPSPTPDPNIKIMIMARQHGNEPAGASAIFSYISDLVNDAAQYQFTNTNILSYSDVNTETTNISNISSSSLDIQVSTIGTLGSGKVLKLIKIQRPEGQSGNTLLPSGITLLFIPTVNVDGVPNNRENNSGANINREWDSLSQLENQIIHYNVFDVYHPEIVIDLHEFTPEGTFKQSFYMTYCPGIKDTAPEQTPTDLLNFHTSFENLVKDELNNQSINYDASYAAQTAVGWVKGSSLYGGNHFCIKHYAINYTVETQGIENGFPLQPLMDRAYMHRIFFETMITYASNNKTQIMNTISGLRGY